MATTQCNHSINRRERVSLSRELLPVSDPNDDLQSDINLLERMSALRISQGPQYAHEPKEFLYDLGRNKIRAGSNLLSIDCGLSAKEVQKINAIKMARKKERAKIAQQNRNELVKTRKMTIANLRDNKYSLCFDPNSSDVCLRVPEPKKKKKRCMRYLEMQRPVLHLSKYEGPERHACFIRLYELFDGWQDIRHAWGDLDDVKVSTCVRKYCPHEPFFLSGLQWIEYTKKYKDEPCICKSYCKYEDWEEPEDPSYYSNDPCDTSKFVTFKTQSSYSEYNNVLTKWVKKNFGFQMTEWVVFIADFVETAWFLVSNNDTDAKRLVLQNWLRMQGIEGLESRIIAHSCKFLVNSVSGWKTQAQEDDAVKKKNSALSDGLDKIGDMLEYVFDSSFADALKTLFLSAASMKWFNKPVASEIYSWLGPPLRNCMYDLLRIFIKSLAKVVKAYEDVMYNDVPLLDALFAKDPWVHANVTAQQLLFQKDHLYNGIEVEGKYNKRMWLKHCNEVLAYLKGRLKKTSSAKKLYSDISQTVCLLEEARCTVLTLMHAGSRHAPFGIVIGEDPGIGKSNLVDFHGFNWCHIKGMPFSDDLFFHRNMSEEYMSGLSTQPLYHYSEPGSETDAIAKKEIPKAFAEINSVMDSLPKMANMADVKDKGKVFTMPEFLIIDTNNMSLNVHHFAKNSAAYMRRFKFAKFTVLPQWRKSNSCEVDGGKVAQAWKSGELNHPLNIYTIDLYEQIAVSPGVSNRVDILNNVDIFTYQAKLRELMKRHVEIQMAVEEMRQGNKMFILDPDEAVPDDVSEASDESDVPGKSAVRDMFNKFTGALNTVKKKMHPKPVRERIMNYEESNDYLNDAFAYDVLQGKKNFFDFNDGDSDVDLEFSASEVKEYEALGRIYNTQASESDDVDVHEQIHNFWTAAWKVHIKGIPYVVISPEMAGKFKPADLAMYFSKEFKCGYIVSGPDLWGMVDTMDLRDEEDKEILNKEYFSAKRAVRIVNWRERKSFPSNPGEHKEFASQRLFRERMNHSRSVKEKVKDFFSSCWSTTKDYISFGKNTILLMYAFLFDNQNFEGKYAQAFKYILCLLFSCFVSFNWIVVSAAFIIPSLFVNFKDTARNWMRSASSTIFWKWLKQSSFLTYLVPGLAVSAAVVALAQSFGEGRQAKTEGSVDDLEREIDAGQSYKRVDVSKNNKKWTLDIIRNPPLCKQDPDYLKKVVARNVRWVIISYPREGRMKVRRGFAFGLKGHYVVMPKHYLSSCSDIVNLRLYNVAEGKAIGQSYEYTIPLEDFVDVGVDMVGFSANCQFFVDVTGHVSSEQIDDVGKGMMLNQKLIYYRDNSPVKVTDEPSQMKYILTGSLRYAGSFHEGDCGWPLIVTKGSGSVICGLHVAGNEKEKAGITSLFDMSKLNKWLTEGENFFCQGVSADLNDNILSDKFFPSYSLEDPIKESAFLHEEFQNLDYYGKFPGNVLAKGKSKLKPSFLHDNKAFFDLFSNTFGFPSKQFAPPRMQSFGKGANWDSPWNINLRKLNVPRKSLNRRIMRRVIKDLTNHLSSGLRGVKLSPVTLDVAINGISWDDYIRSVNSSTSAGFGYQGKLKRDLMPIDNSTGRRALVKEVEDMLIQVTECLKSDIEVKFVYKASLKDEPRDVEKVEKGKTRVFFMSPLVGLLIARMYLLPFFTLMQEYCDLFCTSIGINMHMDSERMFKDLLDFSKLWMEGDYGGYDTSISPDVKWMVASVITAVLKKCGYNDIALLITKNFLMCNISIYICMLNDIFCARGITPSGMYATAELNSLVGVILLMLFWHYHYYDTVSHADKIRYEHAEVPWFFNFVKPNTFGDDLLAAVKKTVSSWFNNVTYASFVKDVLNMEYTSAAKNSLLTPFVDPYEASFLKRTFSYKGDLDRIVGKLDYNSIHKMLVWTIPSESVSRRTQFFMTVDSALRESFFHLKRKKYEVFRNGLMSIIKTHSVDDPSFILDEKSINTHFHSYDKLLLEYRSGETTEIDDSTVVTQGSCNEKLQSINKQLLESILTEGFGRSSGEEKLQWPSMMQNLLDLISSFQSELKEVEEELQSVSNPTPGMSYSDARRSDAYISSDELRIAIDSYYKLLERREELEISIRSAESSLRRIRSLSKFVTQSAVGDASTGEVNPKLVESVENVIDVSGDDVKEFGFGYTDSLMRPASEELQEFMHRWVDIGQYSLPLGSSFFTVVDPWTVYLSEPSVRAKIRNYAFFRANLELKVVIAASQFHYGTLHVAYVPLATDNEIVQFYEGSNKTNYGFQFNQYLSSVFGSVLMKIGDNKPAEIHCPYINYNPMCRLWNNATTVTGSTINDVSYLGRLYIITLNNPAACNSTAPTALSLQVYARMKDVCLGGPTGNQISITTEAKDEFADGPISSISSTLARWAGKLSVIPSIRPYAYASKKVFDAVTSVSTLFGFSAPVVSPAITTPRLIKNDAYMNAVNTTTRCTGKKLTVDPRQELSIDPRLFGRSEDEMSIRFIGSIPSLLDTATWSSSSIAMTTLLWQTYVSPYVNRVGPTDATNYFIQPTCLSYAVRPFAFWRCKLKYKIVINKSIFHKGKLAILFDPACSQYVLITSNLKLNKQRMLIVDIQETDEFEFCVRFVNNRLWARDLPEPFCNRAVGSTFSSAIATSVQDAVSGFITIFPFTTLQSPDGTSVQLNVFVSSDDLEVNYLNAESLPVRRAQTQSKESDMEEVTCFEMSEEVSDGSASLAHVFGEAPVSFRQYLRRYFNSYNSTVLASYSAGVYTGYPLIYPDVTPSFGSSTTISNVYSYLRYAYIGFRGSVRKRYRIRGVPPDAGNAIKVSLRPGQGAPSSTAFTGSTAAPAYQTETGSSTFMPFTNAGVEVEAPVYTPNMFLPSGTSTLALMASLANTNFLRVFSKHLLVATEISRSGTNDLQLIEETAFGDDFLMGGFLSPPPYTTTGV